MLRIFKFIDFDNGGSYGRYRGITPRNAAIKCANKQFSTLTQNQASNGIKIYIKECTRGSQRRVYGYFAQRIKLNQPQYVYIAGKTIIYKYVTKVKPIELPSFLTPLKKTNTNTIRKNSTAIVPQQENLSVPIIKPINQVYIEV